MRRRAALLTGCAAVTPNPASLGRQVPGTGISCPKPG